MIRLGFHTSIAGSVVNAAKIAKDCHYTAFQMFVSSSRSWKHSEIDEKTAEEFRELVKSADLAANAHIPYLCNPSSTNPEMHKKSVEMLENNMQNCSLLGVKYLVIHIGSHLGKGLDRGIENACAAIRSGLDAAEDVEILLENTAGYNHSVGSRFEEIGLIIDKAGSPRVGVCLDTCHAFAAGYDIRTPEAVEDTVKKFDSAIGIGKLKLVHLNDSRFELGSGLDRHWHLGKGFIGKKGFVSLFGNRHFANGTYIMETPVNGDGNEVSNLKAAKEAIASASRLQR